MFSYPLPRSILGLILLVLLGFIWGTGYSIARFAMTNGVPPLGYSFWQSLGPAFAIGALAYFRKYSTQTPFRISFSHIRFYIICGTMGIVVPNTTMYFAAKHLPASILAMVVNTVPVMAYPMALFIGLESFNLLRSIGILLACVGLMAIIVPKTSLPAPHLVPWVLTTLITPLSFAISTIYIAKNRPKNSDTLSLAAGMLISSSLLLTPLVIFQQSFYFFHVPFTMPDWIILLEILLSSIGYLLFFHLIKIAGPVYYSLVDTIVVLTGIFWGHVIFGEQLNEWTKIAVSSILFALVLVTRQQKPEVDALDFVKNN
jgi:drug/metabolite transporter (DMT)-like permease